MTPPRDGGRYRGMPILLFLLPLLAALGGVGLVYAVRDSDAESWSVRASSLGDVVWLGAGLAKLGLLYSAIATPEAPYHSRVLRFDLGLAAAVFLLVLFLTPRLRASVCFFLAGIYSVWIWGDLLHVRFFEDVTSVATLGAAGNLPSLFESIGALVQVSDLLLFLDFVPAAALVVLLGRRQKVDSAPVFSRQVVVAMALLVAPVVVGLLEYGTLVDTPKNSRRRLVFLNRYLVAEYGLLGFHLYDARQGIERRFTRGTVPDADLKEVREWFIERVPERAGMEPWFGFAEGKNLIVVQVEALQAFPFLAEYRGVEITPNLNRRSSQGLRFSATTDQSATARTSDSELLAMASLLPSPPVPAAFAFGANDFVGLPELLRERGYRTLSAVPIQPSFWNRHVTHPGYGFSDSLFRADFGPGQKVGWGLNDRDFLRQMLARLEDVPQPFFSLLITLSLHYPFSEFPDDLRSLPEEISDGSTLGNYLEAMHFLDAAFEELFVGLEEQGLLDESILVLYGDHDSGMAGEAEVLEPLGFSSEPPGWEPFDQIPLVIWVPGEGAPQGEVDEVAGLSDLTPTLLALLGIDPSPYAFVGRNLLGRPRSSVLPRPNDCYVDNEHYFWARGSEFRNGHCYRRSDLEEVEIEECRSGYEAATRQRIVSRLVLEYDLQTTVSQYLRETLQESATERR